MTQPKHSIVVKTDSEVIEMLGRPCELSAYSFIPPQRNNSAESSYFNSAKSEGYTSTTYDRLFNQDYGYNNKLHRCDREHAKSRGLTVNSEEVVKPVPTLASSIYGHRVQQLDPPNRKHARIAHVKSEFYRRNMLSNEQADAGT